MTFLNPIVLVGLIAAGIPVLLHLLNLRKVRIVEFSTLSFLKELQPTTLRRLRIRHLLLLSLRTLLVILLVLAGSTNALGVEGDIIDAGQGANLVFGDNGRITGAFDDAAKNFGTQPTTLGLVETIEYLIGGSDTITTGVGRDIVLGGIDADTIVANYGEYGVDEHAVPVALDADANNIVIGDSGYIDWTAADEERVYAAATAARATLPGDDTNA